MFGKTERDPRTLLMTRTCQQTFTVIVAAAVVSTAEVFAIPVEFTQHFPSGFNVSINGGPLFASGSITVTGIVDDTTQDIDPDESRGEFPLSSVTFTGAGFTNRQIITPLSVLIVTTHRELFAFQLVGQYNEGIMGWDDLTSPGTITSNPNDLLFLTTLPLTLPGTGTFWYQALDENAWVLDGGDSIGADLGGGGPTGTFSIRYIPEPSALALALPALLLLSRRRNRVS